MIIEGYEIRGLSFEVEVNKWRKEYLELVFFYGKYVFWKLIKKILGKKLKKLGSLWFDCCQYLIEVDLGFGFQYKFSW